MVCGKPIDELHRYLATQPVEADDLSTCSLQRAIELTGLDANEARLAQTREYSIPLRFVDSDAEQAFTERAISDGFGVLKGGRFLHLIGENDKGRSQQLLKACYENAHQRPLRLVALGDSPNDQQMLESADIAVLVKSPSSEGCQVQHPELIRTSAEAPEGWVEGIERAGLIKQDSRRTEGAD